MRGLCVEVLGCTAGGTAIYCTQRKPSSCHWFCVEKDAAAVQIENSSQMVPVCNLSNFFVSN